MEKKNDYKTLGTHSPLAFFSPLTVQKAISTRYRLMQLSWPLRLLKTG